MERNADIVGDDRVQTQCLVYDVGKIFHIFEILVGWLSLQANLLYDLLAQLCDDVRLTRHLIDGPGQSARRGIPAREKNRYQLISQHFSVSCVPCDGMQECVARVMLALLLKLTGRQGKGFLDVGVHKIVHGLQRAIKSHTFARYELVQRPTGGG